MNELIEPSDDHSTHILVLGTADWSQAIPTNQHYVVRELAKGARVTFVESIGLRRPQFKLRDISRIWRRLTRRGASPNARRDLPPGVDVLSPRVVPLHKWPFTIANRWLLRRLVRSWYESTDRKLFWTYTPVTYGFEDDAAAAYYHCVDLLGEFPNVDRRFVEMHETKLASRNVTAIASSNAVRAHLIEMGFDSPELWPNVADVEPFEVAAKRRFDGTVDPLPNSAFFGGNLTSSKVDFEALVKLLDRGVNLHLAGPISEGGGDDRAQVDNLVSRGATYHGMLGPAELARLTAQMNVGLIPYLSTSYTRGVSPLKTFEYLAAGAAVVSQGVPSVVDIEGAVWSEQSRTDWVDRVVSVASHAPTTDEVAARISVARENSWATRGERARAFAGVAGVPPLTQSGHPERDVS